MEIWVLILRVLVPQSALPRGFAVVVSRRPAVKVGPRFAVKYERTVRIRDGENVEYVGLKLTATLFGACHLNL